jgi:hypothetical protein
MTITRPTLTDNDTLTAAQANALLVQAIAIEAREVNAAKFAAVAENKLLGRSSAGSGDFEEIACTAAGRALLDDAVAGAQRTTLGLLSMATQNASAVDITGGKVALRHYAATPGTDLAGGSVALDLDPAVATWQTLAVNGNITLTTSNRAAGRVKFLRLVGDGTQRTVNLPAGWVLSLIHI